jgi:hypothetical protein
VAVLKHDRYLFRRPARPGEIATIEASTGEVVLSYRGFASVTRTVALLVSVVIFLSGIAAALLLLAEGLPLRSIAAVALTLLFTWLVKLVVPRLRVTLYQGAVPALTLSEQPRPIASTVILATAEGVRLAEIRQTWFSRLGRNRWIISVDGVALGHAVEEGLGPALARKLLGKFSRRFETDIAIVFARTVVGQIVRRGREPDGQHLLELKGDLLDRRIAVGLASLILGRDP